MPKPQNSRRMLPRDDSSAKILPWCQARGFRTGTAQLSRVFPSVLGTTPQTAQAVLRKPLTTLPPALSQSSTGWGWTSTALMDAATTKSGHPLFCFEPRAASWLQLCLSVSGGGRHLPLGKHQPRGFHWDLPWEESSLHPESKNLFPGSHLQLEQTTQQHRRRLELLADEFIERGDAACSWSSKMEGSSHTRELFSGTMLQQNICQPLPVNRALMAFQPSARPANPQHCWTKKAERCPRKRGAEPARLVREASHDHNVMSPQPQMPHRDSGQTFVFCGLFIPSPPPNLFCAKC